MTDTPSSFEEDFSDQDFSGWTLVMNTMSDAVLFPDATHLLWLTEAYGDAEAARIMGLPYDLRVELYSDVLELGPAGDQMIQVRTATIERASTPSNVWVEKQLHFLGESAGFFEVSKRINQRNDPALVKISKRIHRRTSMRLWSSPGAGNPMVRGFYALMWALNAQHPSFKEFAVQDEDFVQAANALLRVLGFDALTGAFTVE